MRNLAVLFIEDGYLLHSPSPYRLWFRLGFDFGVKDPSQGNGLDCRRLLPEAEEEFAATLGFPSISTVTTSQQYRAHRRAARP